MARLQISFLSVLVAVLCLQHAWADRHFLAPGEQDNNVMSYEVVGTGARSSSISTGDDSKQNTGLYAFRRQRRSIGHHYQPAYVQPVAVVPVNQGYYPHGYHQPQQPVHSHSQAQAISASFGGNHYLGTGGSGISAAAASAGSGTDNQLLNHGYGYGRK